MKLQSIKAMSLMIALASLLVLISVSSYISSNVMLNKTDNIVSEVIPINKAVQNLLLYLLTEQAGIRGYILSGDIQFLEPYESGVNQFNVELHKVQIYADSHADVKALIELQLIPQADKIKDYFKSQIALVSDKKIDEARNKIGDGKSLMDEFRTINSDLAKLIDLNTQNKLNSTKAAGLTSNIIIISGAVLALLIGFFTILLFKRTNQTEQALRSSEEAYRLIAENLEAQNEEIISQQMQQEDTLIKLMEREQELEWISHYQEKLTGYLDLSGFLESSIPALLEVLQMDAALVLVRSFNNPGEFEILYSVGYPNNYYPRMEDELFGAANLVFEKKEVIMRKRPLTEKESGVHGMFDAAFDQYYPLFDDKQDVIGFLLITDYEKSDSDSSKTRLTKGLVHQFDMAFWVQLMNKESYKQAERLQRLNEELSNEKNVIQRILESSHECILMTDKDGTILFTNSQTKAYFQLDEASEQTIAAFCEHIRAHSEKSINIYQPIAKFLADDSQENMNLQFKYSSSKENQKYFDLYVTVVGGDKIGTIHGFLFVFRDRTEEEQILQMKNELISTVSHELRTPLSTVLGFMEILLYRDVKPDKQKKYFQTIYDEAIRLSNLINDFLDLQRMESGLQRYHFTPVRIDLVLRELADQWDGKQGHKINLSLHVKEIYIKADEDSLRQVLQNLLSNAVKYSPGADKVDITLDVVQEQVEIKVQDYGLGIPEDAKRKLFTKFYRVDNSDRRQIGGTGLGLSICKEIVETHGGSLTFTSMMGEGSIFKIQIPEYRIVDVNRKIVFVGNRDIVTQTFQSILESIGFPTVQIHSAAAFVLALEHCKPEEGPAISFVDLNLQGLVSGWNVLDRLYERSRTHRAPVIIFRSVDWFGNMNEYEIEMQIKKPTAIHKLTETIHYLTDKEHQLTYVFPTQDEAIVASLVERGMKIQNVSKKPDFIEVELLAPPV